MRNGKTIFYPVVVSPHGKISYLLAPTMTDFIGPGMVIADLFYSTNFGTSNFLGYSKSFHEPFKYEAMVYSNSFMEKDKFPCQSFIYRISRHYKDNKPEKNIHIDTSLLHSYNGGSLLDENLMSLDSIAERDGYEDFWWEHMNNLPKNLLRNCIERYDKPPFENRV